MGFGDNCKRWNSTLWFSGKLTEIFKIKEIIGFFHHFCIIVKTKSGSRHLSHSNRPFQRGGIEIFQIAVPDTLGKIEKIKIWHDNTGLDPGKIL